MALTSNGYVLDWIEECRSLLQPDGVVWIDGSEAQLKEYRQQAVAEGELIPLNQEKLPGCYLHRSHPDDVARVEDRTFICSPEEKDAGPTNNWKAPAEMYTLLRGIFKGAMRGRKMYVIPYAMGIPGSPFAKYGIELTDSIYVVLSMSIMTRVGKQVLDHLADSPDYIKGLHSKAELDPAKRYIAHFPEDNTVWSVNSGYGGNVLLGKKCFALRIASILGRQQKWLAEHMLILGVEFPEGHKKYLCAAFPSACGKTNLAMLIPPEGYRSKGYKVWTLGDDIAWLRPGKDGRLYAVNPENGFFGVAPGTSRQSNPNALATVMKDTIFTNVVQNLDDNTVWWEGLDENPPENALDWRGNPWNGKTAKTPGAHPNGRFTTPVLNCPCLAPEFDDAAGVPISAIIFGGRRAKTAPLVYQSKSWRHGVFVGSIMGSETTAAAAGAVGLTRRDPMAMLPFCGYNMGDYWRHWLDMENYIANPPEIFNVNWFRTNAEGRLIWPGFGDNFRVLKWILDRVAGQAAAVATPLGYLPLVADINIEGLKLDQASLESLLSIDAELWKTEAKDIREFYAKFGDSLPQALHAELEALEAAFASGGTKI
jgi:phosphoenolpyruvate carboxykinase (GTP)